MNEEQIQKLRRIMIGIEKPSAFSENEIEDLEKRVGKLKKGGATIIDGRFIITLNPGTYAKKIHR